ncbi:MAG: NUDIX domain-containing protein [Candidatus Woesearchaeota archaeon]
MKTVLVVKALILDKNQVLCIQRAADKEFGANRWTTPGGHVEFGESFEDAICREVKEETNLDVTVKQVNMARSFRGKDGAHVIILTYVCHPTTFEIRTNEEIQAYKWMNIDSKSLPAAIAKEIAHYKEFVLQE